MIVDWKLQPLGDVCEFQRGLTYGKSDEVETSSNIVLRANNVDLATHTLDLAELRYIADAVAIPLAKKVRKGSLLICTASGSKSHLGKIAYVDDDYGYAFGGFMGQITPAAGMDGRYLFYALTSPAYKTFIEALSDGININNLKFDDLGQFAVPVPPLPEQRRIVTILDEAFEGIATVKVNAEKNLQNVREWFGSRLEQLFSASDEPKTRLADLCDIKHGYAFDGAHFSTGGDGQAPILLTPGNFTEDGQLQFSERNTKRYTNLGLPHGFVLNEGDLVVVMTDLSSKMKILGKPAIVDRPQLLHNQRIGRVVGLQSRVTMRYLYFFMRTTGYVNAIKRTATGTMVKHTAPRRILDVDLPLPSNERQAEIVAALDESEDQIRKLEANYRRRVEALEALQKSLLQHAFAGALMAKPADEPLEAME